MPFLRRLLLVTLRLFAWSSALVMLIWAIGVVGYLPSLSRWLGALLACGIAFALGVLLFRIQKKDRWLSYAGVAIFAAWLLLRCHQPSNDRNWAKDQIELARVEIANGEVTINNFRHNRYRSESDFDVERMDFEFQLSQLNQVWFLVQRFTPSEGLAHVFLAFEVKADSATESRYFSLSVEIRREEGEFFSPVQGLYRHYELNYVFGDERDLIGVRTLMRPEDRIFMYRVNATPRQVQQLFRSIADRTNQLVERPEFYHTLLNNCMNGILRHTVELTPEEVSWFDPQILFPGLSDRYAYNAGMIGSPGQSFDDLKESSRIDQQARKVGGGENFSRAIRRLDFPVVDEATSSVTATSSVSE